MKTFLVHLDDGRSVPVKADSYMELEHRWHFYRKGEAIAFSFFEAAAVDSITLEDDLDEPYEPCMVGSGY